MWLTKKAFFSYDILATYRAGIQLYGPEVKSIRLGRVNLQDAYCFFKDKELWLTGMHISPYRPAAQANLPAKRPRKLLLKKQELRKLEKQKLEKALTIVGIRVLMCAKGLIKVDIALARGRKKHDKRAAIKRRELDRRLKAVSP